MSTLVPDSMVLRSSLATPTGGYISYTEEGYIRCAQDNVLSPLATIDVERSTTDTRYIHLKFRYSNKYWSRSSELGHWIVATSNQPEEDVTKSSCTLFHPTRGFNGDFFLLHVPSRLALVVENVQSGARFTTWHEDLLDALVTRHLFSYVDWETLTHMPENVSLRGDNQKYLRSTTILNQLHMQFSSDDPNKSDTPLSIENMNDGHVRIWSVQSNRFLRRGPDDWILADSTDDSSISDRDTLFWPVRVSGSTFALRSAANNNFCRLLTSDDQADCFNASATTMFGPTNLLVRELVLERHVYHIRFRMQHMRIYDQRPFVAGTGTSINNTDLDSNLTIRISYEEKRSHAFTNSSAVTSGVATRITTGIPRIVGMEVEVSREETSALEWGETVEETRIAEASVTVSVPARSQVRVDYVGTQGTCSVPFSYTQRDRRSTDGQFVSYEREDGVFTGVNYYSFHFEHFQFTAFAADDENTQPSRVLEGVENRSISGVS